MIISVLVYTHRRVEKASSCCLNHTFHFVFVSHFLQKINECNTFFTGIRYSVVTTSAFSALKKTKSISIFQLIVGFFVVVGIFENCFCCRVHH